MRSEGGPPAIPVRRELEPRQRVDGDGVGRDAANVAEELGGGILGKHPADAFAGPQAGLPARSGRARRTGRALPSVKRRRSAGMLIAADEFQPPRRYTAPMTMDNRKRWLALLVLCLGDLMIVLDVTIVGVALPSIREDLGFSDESLAWVVNAYLITFGGFLLLGGRLGDLFGHRRLFLIGIGLFTLASMACGFSTSQEMLVIARAVQGVGGAIVSAVALSLMMMLFTTPAERAKAMGIFGFVASGGGSLGVLLGGILTDVLNWHWIFLVNVPVGILVVGAHAVAASRPRACRPRRSASTSRARSPSPPR